METKLCRKHNNGEGAVLPVSAFYPIKKGGERLQPYCKECCKGAVIDWQKKNPDKALAKKNRWKERHPEQARAIDREGQARRRAANPEKFKAYWFKRDLMRFYGVTPEWYAEQIRKQGGACAICGIPTTGKKRLAVDHHHRTAATFMVRGLLCIPCNTAIGAIERSEDWHKKAIFYLSQYDPKYCTISTRNGIKEVRDLNSEELKVYGQWLKTH